MPITIARCANVFGPGDLNMNRIFPGIFESVIKGKLLSIRSDGKMIREYIYVDDAIEGYIALAESIEKTKGQAFNISSKSVLSTLDVVERVSQALGKKVQVEILNQAKTEIPEQHLDGTKIKNVLGWEAETSFEKAIAETYEWYKENLR
jgi:CDP-glucose 4,6-dehydratase